MLAQAVVHAAAPRLHGRAEARDVVLAGLLERHVGAEVLGLEQPSKAGLSVCVRNVSDELLA